MERISISNCVLANSRQGETVCNCVLKQKKGKNNPLCVINTILTRTDILLLCGEGGRKSKTKTKEHFPKLSKGNINLQTKQGVISQQMRLPM